MIVFLYQSGELPRKLVPSACANVFAMTGKSFACVTEPHERQRAPEKVPQVYGKRPFDAGF